MAAEVSEALPGKSRRIRDEWIHVLKGSTACSAALTVCRFAFMCSGQERSRDHLAACWCQIPSSVVHSPTSNASVAPSYTT